LEILIGDEKECEKGGEGHRKQGDGKMALLRKKLRSYNP
jgi:hypothetical protein